MEEKPQENLENQNQEEVVPEEKLFDILNDTFEGAIIYKSVSGGFLKRSKASGIIKPFKAEVGSEVKIFFYVFDDPEDLVPKTVIPYHLILEWEIFSEDGEEELDNEKDDERLDLETRIDLGADSLGDLDITDTPELDIT